MINTTNVFLSGKLISALGLHATGSQELQEACMQQSVSAGTVKVQIGQQTSHNVARVPCGLASEAWANPESRGLLVTLPDLGQSPQAVKEERGLSYSLGWILNSQGIMGREQVGSEWGSEPDVGESQLPWRAQNLLPRERVKVRPVRGSPTETLPSSWAKGPALFKPYGLESREIWS